MPLDWTRGKLADGLECYRSGRFFSAHEHWEEVWLHSQEPEKSFLQAMIQIAAAIHHLEQHNTTGAESLLRRALARLSMCPAVFGGIEIESLREEVAAWINKIEAGSNAKPNEYPLIRPIIVRPK